MDRPSWAPSQIDPTRPSPARIYDYHLGGAHNFAVDRQAAEQLTAIMPELPLIIRANRAFLRRAVRTLAEAGIRQFLDLGSGIPTVGNVHQLAAPGSRVVYVDVDPIAVAHAQSLLSGNDDAGVVHADLRDVSGVLTAPEVRRLIDFTRPVGVLLVAVLHFVPDRDDPAGIVSRYRDAVSSGSYLVVSHAAASEDDQAPAGAEEATAAYSRRVSEFTLRTRSEVAGLFAGFELIPPRGARPEPGCGPDARARGLPGVVYVNEWRPETPGVDGSEPRLAQLVGVGRKP